MNRRRWIRLLPLTALAIVLVTPAAAAQSLDTAAVTPAVAAAEARLLELVNGERAGHGLAPLVSRDDVQLISRLHSGRMAAANEIFHNDDFFSAAVKQQLGARRRGENVGTSTSVEMTHQRLMESELHRANILDPGFSVAGFGVAITPAGRYFITEGFIEPSGQATSAAPAPVVTAAPAPIATAAPEPSAPSVRPRAAAPKAPSPTAPPATAAPPATTPVTEAPPLPEPVPVTTPVAAADPTPAGPVAMAAPTRSGPEPGASYRPHVVRLAMATMTAAVALLLWPGRKRRDTSA